MTEWWTGKLTVNSVCKTTSTFKDGGQFYARTKAHANGKAHTQMVCSFGVSVYDDRDDTDAYKRTPTQLFILLEAGTKRVYVLPDMTAVLGDADSSSGASIVLQSLRALKALKADPDADTSAQQLHLERLLLTAMNADVNEVGVYAINTFSVGDAVDVNTVFSQKDKYQCIFKRSSRNGDMVALQSHLQLAFTLLRNFRATTIVRKVVAPTPTRDVRPPITDVDIETFTPFD